MNNPYNLTDRQIKVLTAAAAGMANWEVAELLRVHESVVRADLNKAVEALGARNVTNAVAIAIANGVIQFQEA